MKCKECKKRLIVSVCFPDAMPSRQGWQYGYCKDTENCVLARRSVPQ